MGGKRGARGSPRRGRARAARLAGVAHELRGHLNGIQTWTYVLESHFPDAPAPVARAIAGIRSGIQEQALLIERMLGHSGDAPSSPEGPGKGGG